LVLGLSFTALGISGQRTFLAAGLAFVVIGIAMALRRRREGGSWTL